ncbi:MAG: hypothetical protein IJB74_02875 [Clostridia bacterium]|nr:hypothetical protein [Clostridia bacterium]
MSYCVNCGVELDISAHKCALCGTAVYNPNENVTEQREAPHPFSEHVHLPDELSPYGRKKLILAIVTTVMAIPNIVCVLLNLTLFKSNPWSLGVISGTLFLWSAFVLPFATKRPFPYILWTADSILACLNALVFVWLYGDMELFIECLLPVIVSCSACVLVYMLWYKKERHIILKIAFVFLSLSFALLFSGIILNAAQVFAYGTEIGIICFVSLFAVACFFFYCYSSKTIRRWASKRFFF